jgi:hypothetical protein
MSGASFLFIWGMIAGENGATPMKFSIFLSLLFVKY